MERGTRALARAAALTLLIIIWAVGASAATAQATVTVGLSDSDAGTFTDPNFPGLNITTARAVVPYDVAETPANAGTPQGQRRAAFINWLNAINTWNTTAGHQQITPLVTLQASVNPANEDANGNPVAPTLAQYTAAVQAFVAKYGPGTAFNVTQFGAWNEPDLTDASVNPLRSQPALAAQFWVAAQQACTGCTVVAGDLAGVSPGDTWIDQYEAGLQAATQAASIPLPAVWAWHPHTDVNDYQDPNLRDDAPVTRWYLNQLTGVWANSQIWLDEVGSRYRDTSGKVWGDASQQQGAEFALGLASLSPRITRIYYYNLSNGCSTASTCAIQDRGLVAPAPTDGSALTYDTGGRQRAAWSVVANRGPVISPAAAILPAVTVTQPGRPPISSFSGTAGSSGGDSPTVTVNLYRGTAPTGTPIFTLTPTRTGTTWSIGLGANLPDGTYTVQATQVGATGDTATSPARTFVIDTTPPQTRLTHTPKARGTATGASFDFAANETSTFTCSLDNSAYRTCKSSLIEHHLKPGRHRFAVRATDAAGNTDPTPATTSWVIVSPPAITTTAARGLHVLTTTVAKGLTTTATCPQACTGAERAYITTTVAAHLKVKDGHSVTAKSLGLPGHTRYLAVGRVALTRRNRGKVTPKIRFDRVATKQLDRSRTPITFRLSGTATLADGSVARLQGRATLTPAGYRRTR